MDTPVILQIINNEIVRLIAESMLVDESIGTIESQVKTEINSNLMKVHFGRNAVEFYLHPKWFLLPVDDFSRRYLQPMITRLIQG